MKMLCWVTCLLMFVMIDGVKYRPVVLMHGITSNAHGMDDVGQWIRETFDGIYVVSIEVGNGREDSYLVPLDKQVEIFCENVEKDLNLVDGFNLIGYSQGSVVVRGAVERCSLPVFNLITLSGIHQGTFGIPYLTFVPEQFRVLISKYAYEVPIQNALSPPSYWRDPTQLDLYYSNCHFLPDINNERKPMNQLYRDNMLKLNSFVMTYSDIDEVIMPKESGLFLGYAGSSLQVETRNTSRQFNEDLIGLRTLYEQGKLFTYTSHVKHQDVTHEPNKSFFFQNIISFLNNTLS